MSQTREHLLGYLLGALEPHEQEQVEAELNDNPSLRAEMRRLQSALDAVGMSERPDAVSPPPGLALRTCRFVAAETEPTLTTRVAAARLAGESVRRYSWSDILAGAAALTVAAALFFPALVHSRSQAQIANCQNNLRYLGMGFLQHSELSPDGRILGPAEEGNRAFAGVAGARLVNDRLVPSHRVLMCPASPRNWDAEPMVMPTMEEIDAARGSILAGYQRMVGGDYGFPLGYTEAGRLMLPRLRELGSRALVSDAPSDARPGRQTLNHGGRGQNLLRADGSVQFMVEPPVQLPDDPFHNREGDVAAGLDPTDDVLGASHDRPLPVRLIKQ